MEILSLLALLVDQLMVVIGFLLAYWIRFDSGLISLHGFTRMPVLADYTNLFTLGSAFMFAGLLLQNMYQYLELMQPWRLLGRLFWVNLVCLFAFIGISLVAKTDPPISRLFVFFSFIDIFVFIYTWRLVLSWILHKPRFVQSLHQRVIFIGWNEEIEAAHKRNAGKLNPIYDIVGYVSTSHSGRADLMPNAAPLGSIYELEDLFELYAVDVAVVTGQSTSHTELLHLASLCEQVHVQFALMPEFFDVLIAGLRASYVAGLPVLSVTGLPLNIFTNQVLKRALDTVGALFGLIVFSPVFIVFAALVFLESPGSVIFKQERVGQRGHRFKMLKIRTMCLDADKADNLNQSTLRNDPRMLRIGAFLRKYNIDELPQFWNVLKGDMSLVGPRPERTHHSNKLKHEIPHYNARYNCKPGMTGWAQVNGWRGNTSLEQRIRHDIWYLENWTFWLDLKIMFLTFIRRDNAY